jgi:hypothetical protein
MIPLEKQVVSLDLAKRLKELGVKQESVWYWFRDRLILGRGEGGNMQTFTSAFTVAELGEMLPINDIRIGNVGHRCVFRAKVVQGRFW